MLGRADPEEKKVQAWMEALMMHDGNAKMKKLEGMKARRRRKVGDTVAESGRLRPSGAACANPAIRARIFFRFDPNAGRV